jgi:ubiquinone/menaquinone biosynthesis C-methylase UbiE
MPQAAQQHHPPRNAEEYAKVLENPKRDEWQKPHEVITALKLRSGEVAADIGAGSGYFTRRLAHHTALVYAVDIDARLLEMIGKQGIPNIRTIHAAPDDPKLPDASVDTIFICDVLHHIDQRPAYYAKLAKALKPGGRIVIIDFFKKKLPVGPPESMKLSEEQVVEELKAAGFEKTAAHDFLPYQYFLEFRSS